MKKFIIENGTICLTSFVSVVIMKTIIDSWLNNKKSDAKGLFILLCICYIVVLLLSKNELLLIILVMLPVYTWFKYSAQKKKKQEEKEGYK